MRSFLALALLVLAGCATPVDDVVVDNAVTDIAPTAVVALVDTGINPYHIDFRDDSPRATAHPSTYLPGFPADAPAVQLTLDAESLEDALEADEALWDDLQPGTLYWFPGTKIVGAIALDGEPGNIIFSTGHGTMVASRAAGAYSLCPECRIVSVQGFNADSVTWASEQPWIDAQSNSWSPQVVFQQADIVQSPGLADAFEEAAARHLVFGSAGNGVAGKLGVVGHPSFTRSTSGAPGVIAVGGHDNGKVALWPGSWPQIVADSCANWAAVGNTLDEYSDRAGGGTSSASPYATGAAARIVLEARILSGEHAPVQDGVLATIGDAPVTIKDVQRLLMVTATQRPVQTEHDGAQCSMASPYATTPVEWAQLPDDVHPYPFVGYGQISVDSLALALDVLHGAEAPDRSDADEWHARAQTMRDAYNSLR